MQPVAALAVAIALVGAAWPLAAARADERPAMEPEATKSREPKVFLGGSCNPTTWRKDIAIPALEEARVPYYNPQVDDWKPELADVEAKEKERDRLLLFVIDAQTRAIASILEATEYTVAGREVLLVVQDIADGAEIAGQTVTGRELKDLNRARAYLRELAGRHPNATLLPDVGAAVAAVIERLGSAPRSPTGR